MAEQCDLVLVIGSTNSSNSQRLVDVARDYGADAHLIDNETQVQEEWLEGARVVGISSGASAPEELVERLVAVLPRRAAPRTFEEFEVMREDVRFMLPKLDPAAASGANWVAVRRRILLGAGLTALVAVLLPVALAGACSCLPQPTHQRLAASVSSKEMS